MRRSDIAWQDPMNASELRSIIQICSRWIFQSVVLLCIVQASAETQCSQVQEYTGSDGVVKAVLSLENSIGYSGLDSIQQYGSLNQTTGRCRSKIASMVNKAGQKVEPSVPTAQAAVRSSAARLLSGTTCPGFGLCGTLLDAADEGVWPITVVTYMIIPLYGNDTDHGCAKMKAVQDYATWILTSGKVGDIATSLQWAVMSLRISQAALDIIQRMTCTERSNVTYHMDDITDSVSSITGSGSTLQSELQNQLTSDYFLQTTVAIHYSSVGSTQGIADLIAGQVDFACAESMPDFTNPTVINRHFQMIPVFAGAIAIIYNVPSLDSLVLSRAMVNYIFIGTLDTWNDPSIAVLNKNFSSEAVEVTFKPPDASMIRVVRRDGSGTTQAFARALYMFADLPNPPNYTLHPLKGLSLPTWPNSVEPFANGAICYFANCTEDTGSTSSTTPIWILVGTFSLGLSLLLLSTVVFLWFLKRRVEPEEEIRLSRAIEDLRLRLHITRREGYYLTSEKLPWFRPRVPIVIIPKRAIEAAARMELQEDFDLNQFNAFCICLEGDKGFEAKDGKFTTSLQHDALCNWILEISEKLIKVELERQPTGVYRLLSKRRFSFFVNKVSKIQLWQFHENSGFKQLKSKVEDFMNQVSPWCDERYRELCAEPSGQALKCYRFNHQQEQVLTPYPSSVKMRHWTEEENPDLSVIDLGSVPDFNSDAPFRTSSLKPTGVQLRQDSDQVRAVRIDSEARMEADLESAVAMSAGVDLDEDVFISQLFRRANLLNMGFQQKMVEIVRKHASDARHADLTLEDMLRPSGRLSPDTQGFVNIRCAFAGGPAVVQVHAAPIKTVARMREKLGEYSNVGAGWPLAANILDPVRMSIVVFGSAQILEVMEWFEREEETGLKIVRVKNKFAFAHKDVVGGYRDMTVSVLYEGGTGLRIIGEIQIQDKVLYDLKLKMHSLYKIRRAHTAAKIF